MNELIIRQAVAEDVGWAAQLLSGSEPWTTLGATIEQFKITFSNPEYHIYMAMLDAQPAGLIVMHPRGLASSPYIKSVAVAEAFRKMGIGKRLMEFAENYFHHDSRYLFLCVSSFNLKAKIFYEHLGYRKAGELDDYIIEGQSEIIMQKKIS